MALSSHYLDPATARTYRLVTAGPQFGPPASDLVAMLAPTADMRILDVGTGTGIVAERMRQSAGRTAVIVGVDGSLTMLDEARRDFVYPVVAACLPQLPFVSNTFDMAAAGFVISHVPAYEAALKDIARVCRSGARIGMTAWGSSRNAAAQLWADIASRFVARADLDEAFRAHIPWDEWFSEATRLEHALHTAGLAVTTVETHVYRVRMSTRDFLLSREGSIHGPVLRERLSAIGGNSVKGNCSRRSRRHSAPLWNTTRTFISASRKRPDAPSTDARAAIFARSGASAASAARGLPRHGSRRPPAARAAPRT